MTCLHCHTAASECDYGGPDLNSFSARTSYVTAVPRCFSRKKSSLTLRTGACFGGREPAAGTSLLPVLLRSWSLLADSAAKLIPALARVEQVVITCMEGWHFHGKALNQCQMSKNVCNMCGKGTLALSLVGQRTSFLCSCFSV